jgi:hypothetical protein
MNRHDALDIGRRCRCRRSGSNLRTAGTTNVPASSGPCQSPGTRSATGGCADAMTGSSRDLRGRQGISSRLASNPTTSAKRLRSDTAGPLRRCGAGRATDNHLPYLRSGALHGLRCRARRRGTVAGVGDRAVSAVALGFAPWPPRCPPQLARPTEQAYDTPMR